MSRYDADDVYCIPGTAVLKNTAGIPTWVGTSLQVVQDPFIKVKFAITLAG